MSKEAVEAIIGRAVLDGEFREALFADPEQVLEGYELTEEEVAGLKSIDAETMESMADTLDERISKAFGIPYLFYGEGPGGGPGPVDDLEIRPAVDTHAGLIRPM